MSSETVINHGYTDFRKSSKTEFADFVIYPFGCLRQRTGVLTTTELLTRLDERGIRPMEIARVLGVNPSRVTEIKKGDRAVKLDEAAKLVKAFDLESPPSPGKVAPLQASITRLIVEYIALELGCVLEENRARIDELAEDVRAFAEFVADPVVRESVELSETFFRAMTLRRAPGAREARSESGHASLD